MSNLLLLHGALGAKTQFAELKKQLSSDFCIHTINFSGHGGEPIPLEPFSIKLFSNDVLVFLDSNEIDVIDIFGYSMGGYAAVYLAKHFPERVGRIFTLGTKFKWNEEISSHEVKMLDPVKMKEKIPGFYDELVQRHAPQSVELVLQKTADMMTNLGRDNELKMEDYSSIQHEILIGLGDRDRMVTLEETIDVYSRLPNGKYIMLPNTSHQLEGVSEESLETEIRKFFS